MDDHRGNVMDVRKAVLEYFESVGSIPGNSEEEKLHCYYLDEKVIDSMGIVAMILEFEGKFGITFQTEEMQSEEFTRIGSLIAMIERKIVGKS